MSSLEIVLFRYGCLMSLWIGLTKQAKRWITLFRRYGGDARKRRDRLYIIAEILKAARNGIQKPQIMYKASLSFAQLTAYLSLLVKFGLLEATKQNEKIIYKTTSKGIRYLKSYEEIKHLLQESTEHSVASLGRLFLF